MTSPPRSITVSTRRSDRNRDLMGAALRKLAVQAADAGVRVRLSQDEVEHYGIGPDELENAELGADPDGDTGLSVVLGGDGTILAALRRYAHREVPVFAVNFGTVGFLATIERDELESGFARALRGDFDVIPMPALEVQTGSRTYVAANDVSFHRRPDLRVAELGYSVSEEALGAVRCDGLVVATPAGSTGYNLANGGPVLAWGVEGFVVSFIAPHTLTARALVVAPDDVLRVRNSSSEEPVDLTTDGRTICSLDPEEEVEVRFRRNVSRLAQVSGASFYARMRDKFGQLTH